MAATRKDRGNSWASRAPLNDDRAPIVAKLVEATFSSWACSWGPGGCFVVCWLVDSLYPPPNCGLERTSRFRRWHRPSKDLFRAVVSGVWRFFFFVRTTIVASLDGQQDVQCSKVHLLAERSWTDDMQGPWASPSNVRGLRPGRPHNLPQVRFLCLQVFVTHCANATTKPVSARTSTSVPRTRSSFSAFAFTETHIVKVTGKGATTTLPIPSPSHPVSESRRRDRQSKLRKARRTKHENKESISIQLSLLILNLEEGDITLHEPRSLKTKVLPVAVDKWSSATLAWLVVGSRLCHVSSQRRWPGCQAARTAKRSGLMSATLARAPAIFCSRKKSAKNHWISWHCPFNFFTAWTIFMKLGTLVYHVHGYKTFASDFLIFV